MRNPDPRVELERKVYGVTATGPVLLSHHLFFLGCLSIIKEPRAAARKRANSCTFTTSGKGSDSGSSRCASAYNGGRMAELAAFDHHYATTVPAGGRDFNQLT